MTDQIDKLLEVKGVTKVYSGGLAQRRSFAAVENISLDMPMDKPSTVTIAGESGSGKTTLALMVLGMLMPTSGEILFQNTNINEMRGSLHKQFRQEVQAVFQNPYDVFNPFYRIRHVFTEPINRFRLVKNRAGAIKITSEALEVVHLDPEEVLDKYPHQLSGGQLQRIMLARAFLLKPKLIVADEPVSMIDASLRTVILDIMIELKKNFGISLLYITHDLSTALQISDKLIITYRGNIVEEGDAATVIRSPKHPYTQLLIESIPLPDPNQKWTRKIGEEAKEEIGVELKGCKFIDKCPFKMEICSEAMPPLYRIIENHRTACYLFQSIEKV